MPLEGAVSVTVLQRSSVAALAAPISFMGVAVNDNKEPGPNSIAMLLGELRGEMRGFREDMAEVKDALADASTSRGQLSEKISLMDSRLQKVEGTVTTLGGVVAKQTTRIDKIEPWIVKLAAVAGGLLMVGGALWYGVMNYGAALLDWIVTLRTPKP